MRSSVINDDKDTCSREIVLPYFEEDEGTPIIIKQLEDGNLICFVRGK